MKNIVFIFLLAAVVVCQAENLPLQNNIATKNAGAVITVSDSAEIARHRPGAMYDGKKDTAWLTGAVQNDHDIEVNWFCRNVTVGGISIDFTPVDYKYRESYSYLSFLSGVKAAEHKGKSVLPANLKISVKQYGKWKDIGTYPVKDNNFICRFPEVLKDIQRVRIALAAPAESRVAIRELQISGIPGEGANAMKNIPSFSSSGAYFVWLQSAASPVPANKPVRVYFRTPFELSGKKPVAAVLTIAAYNQARLYLNGKMLLTTPLTIPEFRPRSNRMEVPVNMLDKVNLIACQVDKTDLAGGLYGVIYELAIRYADGTEQVVSSNRRTTRASVEYQKNWNDSLTGFEKWQEVRNRRFSRGYPADYWAVDFSEPFQDDEVILTSCRLTPATPRGGERYKLELEFDVPQPLKHTYAVSARFGNLPLDLHADLSLGANATTGKESLHTGFKGKKRCVISGCWPEEVSSSLPVRLAVANGKEQAFIRTDIGKMLPSPLNGQVEVISGEKPVILPPGFSKSELRDSKFYLNGKPAGLFFFGVNKLTAGQVNDQLDSGALQMFRVCRFPFIADGENARIAQDNYIRTFESFANYILQKNPEAKFMLVFTLDPLAEWLFENPDEQIELGDGSRLMGLYNNRGSGNLQVRASMAGKLYRKVVYDSIYQLVSRLKKHPYAHSVTAVAIAAGLAHENNWGVDRYDFTKGPRSRSNSIVGDFGPAARKAVVEFLMRRYGSDKAWAEAWKQPAGSKISDFLSFDKWSHEKIQNIMLWRERPSDRFIFRDGQRDGRIAEDLGEFCSLTRAEVMLVAAKAVKDASDRHLLVGGYAGYVFPQLINNPVGSSVYSGHAAAKLLRESKDFDYFSSPQWCHTLDLPVFYSVLNDSLRLYGKTFIVEGDIRTHSAAFGYLFSRKSMISQLRKISGFMLSKQFGAWFLGWSYSFAGPQAVRFFSDPAVLSELKLLRESSMLPAVPTRKPGERIALLVSEQSSWYMDLMSPANTVHASLLYKNLHKFLRTGAGCDIMSLEDLPQLVKSGKLKDYRFVAFYNAFHLNKELRSLINKEVKSSGRTVLFFYAPGFHDDDFNFGKGSSVSTAGIADVLGVKEVSSIARAHILGAKWQNGNIADCKIWWDGGQKRIFSDKIGPVFYLKPSAQLEKLAVLRLDGVEHPDKIAAARIKGKDHTVIYVAVPDVDREVLNQAVRDSGTCIAADGEVIVNAGNGFMTVTNRGKARRITLQTVEPCDWIELPGNRKAASGTKSIQQFFDADETKLYRLIQR